MSNSRKTIALIEGRPIEITSTGFRGGHFTRFFVRKAPGQAPGHFVWGSNPAYSGRYTMIVARPDVKARKCPNWNGRVRRGFATYREAKQVANTLNQRDRDSYGMVCSLGELHGTKFREDTDGFPAALQAMEAAVQVAGGTV